jgi:hypothetical protein
VPPSEESRAGSIVNTLPAEPPRIGLLVDSLEQPAWIVRALERVSKSGAGRIELVVVNRGSVDGPAAGNAGGRARSRLATWWRNRDELLYAAYTRYDRRRFASDDDPFAARDIAALVAGARVFEVTPRQTAHSDYIPDADLAVIRAADLDVLVRFGFRILRGGILEAARHGVWSYHHGDHRRYRGGPPCFWEVLEGEPTTGTVLQRLTEELDDGEILCESYSATDHYSVERSRCNVYWKGSELLVRALQRLPSSELADRRPAAEVEPSSYGHRLYVAPRTAEMARGLARIGARRIRSKAESLLSYEQWYIAWRRRRGVPADSREPDLAPFRFKPLVPPPDRFWADPFVLRSEGREFVMFEDYAYATGRGRISLLEIGPKGAVGDAQPVLAPDYHVSYPFVFSWRGEQLLLPETADVSRVELYRATRYPYEWTLESVPMEGLALADCTLAEIDGRWWMFANAAVPGASFWDELHLFHAPSPLGPWTAHPRNPVVSDVRTARPAGGLFRRNGRWYRPSQDCSAGYGWAINIQRITRLDPHDYAEEHVSKLSPDWLPGLLGTHTINALGGLTVIDARRRLRKLPWQVSAGTPP